MGKSNRNQGRTEGDAVIEKGGKGERGSGAKEEAEREEELGKGARREDKAKKRGGEQNR